MNGIEQFTADIKAREASLDAIDARIKSATTVDEVATIIDELDAEKKEWEKLARRNSSWTKQTDHLKRRNLELRNRADKRSFDMTK